MGSRPILGEIGRAKFQFYIFHKYKINQKGLKSKFEGLREIHQIRYFAKMGGSRVREGVVTRLCLVRVGYFRDISYRSSGGFCGYPSEMCGAGVLC